MFLLSLSLFGEEISQVSSSGWSSSPIIIPDDLKKKGRKDGDEAQGGGGGCGYGFWASVPKEVRR